ncbi:MAG: hypothetical protein ABIO02_01165 [Patescibacteria group bacterium]
MLSKKDLQSIGDVVGKVVREIVDERLETRLAPIIRDIKYLVQTLRSTIDLHGGVINNHENRVSRLEATMEIHLSQHTKE